MSRRAPPKAPAPEKYVKAPSFEEYLPWTLEKLSKVAGAVNQGDFSPLGMLEMWLCTQGRVGSCNNARMAGWINDARLKPKGGTEIERSQLKEDFERAFDVLPTFDILTDLRFLCASLCQYHYLDDGLPYLEPWKIALLKREGKKYYVEAEKDMGEEQFLTLRADEKIDISPTGGWVLLGTERVRYPWHSFRAAWNIVAPMCIGGMNGFIWWMRNAYHTSIAPILVKTTGQSAGDSAAFWKALLEIAQMQYLEVPPGLDVDRLKSNPMDHTSPKELTLESDMRVAEYLLGQSLSTRMDKGGSYAAVSVMVDRISAPQLLLELKQLADALNASWLTRWKHFRGVTSDVRLAWSVESLDDRLKLSEIVRNIGSIKNA